MEMLSILVPSWKKKREVLNIVKEMSKRWINSRWKLEKDKNLKSQISYN